MRGGMTRKFVQKSTFEFLSERPVERNQEAFNSVKNSMFTTKLTAPDLQNVIYNWYVSFFKDCSFIKCVGTIISTMANVPSNL